MAAKQLVMPGNIAFNSRGLAVPNAVATLYEAGTLTPAAFYADAALSVSLGSSITADGIGRFPIAYQDEAIAFRLRVTDEFGALLPGGDVDPYHFGAFNGPLVVTGAAGQSVSTRLLLAAIAAPAAGQSALLAEAGREGTFVFSSANNAANVTADPQQIAFVAPASDTTGASGAWVRKDKVLRYGMAGAKQDGTDDLAALDAMNAFFFNDGSTFYDYSLDVTANVAVAGTHNMGPSAASVVSRRWNVSGQLTVKQLQAGVVQSIKVRHLNYGVYPIRFEPIGYGSNFATFANRDTLFGVTFENCAYSQFLSVFGHGHYYAAVNVIGNSPLFAEHLRIGNVIGQYCGSGYAGAGYSLTSTWTSGTQTGAYGSTAQSQLINIATLPKAAIDTLGPAGTFPGAVYLRIGADPEPYLVAAIDRATGNVTINAWLRPAAGASGTLTWCFGGAFFIQGSDTEGAKVDKLYGILSGGGLIAASAYGPTMGEIDVENCGVGVVFGSNPNSVSYGHFITNLYCEANSEDVIYIGHWGTFQYSQIASSYTITASKIHQIGDPTNADGSFGFAGGGLGINGSGKASIEILGTPHRLYGAVQGSSNVPTTAATFIDHGEKPTIRPQFRDSQTVTLGTVDVNLTRLFGYPGAAWCYVGSGTNGAPTGTFTFVPPSGGTINGGAADASVAFSGFTGPATFIIFHTDAANLVWQVRLLGGGAPVARLQTVASAATVTPDAANDQVNITAQAAALTLANPTGTPITGQEIMVRIKDNGTARAIAYGTQYRAFGTALPTTTTISKTTYLRARYNATDTKWDVINAVTEV